MPTPSLKGSVTDATYLSNVTGLDRYGDYVVACAQGSNRLSVISVANPTAPTVVGSAAVPSYQSGARDVVVVGTYAFVTDWINYRLHVFSLATPTAPAYVTSLSHTNLSRPEGMAVYRPVDGSGPFLLIATSAAQRLNVVDVANPTNPVLVGSVQHSSYLNEARCVTVIGNHAVVTSSHYVTVVSIANPAAPVVVGQTPWSPDAINTPRGVVMHGELALVASYSADTVAVVDVTSRTSPTIAGKSPFVTGLDGPRALTIIGDHLVSVGYDGYARTASLTYPTTPSFDGALQVGGDLWDVVALDNGYVVVADYNTHTVRVIDPDLNKAPNAPSLNYPVGSVTLDRAVVNRFRFTPSDPNPGDVQTAYEVGYRLVGASTWTTVTGGSTGYHDFPAGTFAAGDYEWRARTADRFGQWGPHSTPETFTAADAPSTVTITDPINNATMTQGTYEVQWSGVGDAFEIRTVADAAGSPDETIVYTESGTVESPTTRAWTVEFAVDDRAEHIQVRQRDGELWSEWASVRVEIDFTLPAVPRVQVAVDDAAATITLTITNPEPTGTEPVVVRNDVLVRVADLPGARPDLERPVGGLGVRIAMGVANNGTFVDGAVGEGIDYEYRVVSYGDNGTWTVSGWTGAVIQRLLLEDGGFLLTEDANYPVKEY